MAYPKKQSKLYLSNMAYTSEDGWWIVHMIVRPLAARRWSDVIKLCAMNASRPDVGSSAKSSGGFVNTLEEKRNEGEACIQWALWCAITKSLAKLFLKNEATRIRSFLLNWLLRYWWWSFLKGPPTFHLVYNPLQFLGTQFAQYGGVTLFWVYFPQWKHWA